MRNESKQSGQLPRARFSRAIAASLSVAAIAAVAVVVHRRAADVHAYVIGIERLEDLFLAREGVVDLQGHACLIA